MYEVFIKKYSSLLFVLIGIIVLYILFNVFNKKEGLIPSGAFCNLNKPKDCESGRCDRHMKRGRVQGICN
jgi:hypothetical protein